MSAKARKRAPFRTQDPVIQREKEAYAKVIAKFIDDNEITQQEAANIMKDAASQVSLVCSGKLQGFSTDRLRIMASRLGFNITTTISKSTSKQGKISLISK